jgi:hypothetical protein
MLQMILVQELVTVGQHYIIVFSEAEQVKIKYIMRSQNYY